MAGSMPRNVTWHTPSCGGRWPSTWLVFEVPPTQRLAGRRVYWREGPWTRRILRH